MDVENICPPNWPLSIWNIVHPPKGTGTTVDKSFISLTHELFSTLSVYYTATQLGDSATTRQVQQVTGEQLQKTIQQLLHTQR